MPTLLSPYKLYFFYVPDFMPHLITVLRSIQVKTTSAAMIVRHPKAQPVLSPLIVCGSAAGINTSLTSLKPRNPRLRPTMRMVGLTVRKPVLTLIAMGPVTALAMTKTSATGLRPNQSIASGRIAIAGSGLSIEVNSTSTSSPMRVHVAKVVSTAARHIPTSIPRPSISRVTSVAAASSPLAQPSQNASAIFAGLETSSGLTPETDTYSCQSKTIATSSIERRATVGSEDHLSLEVLFRALGVPGVVEEAFTSLEDCMIHILPFIGQKLAQMPSRLDKLFRIRVFYVTYVHDLLYLRGRVAEYHYAVTDQKRFLDAVGHEQYRHAGSGRDLVQLFL